jgi:hypothetical protein
MPSCKKAVQDTSRNVLMGQVKISRKDNQKCHLKDGSLLEWLMRSIIIMTGVS